MIRFFQLNFKDVYRSPLSDILPETNIAPENQWLEDVFPTEIVPIFRGHLSFPVVFSAGEKIYIFPWFFVPICFTPFDVRLPVLGESFLTSRTGS